MVQYEQPFVSTLETLWKRRSDILKQSFFV
jgi:hypothetical protein